jgi:hypothetical protein
MTVICVSAALGVAALAVPVFLKRATATVTESLSEPVPTGTIPENDTEFCKRLKFDDSGRVFQDAVPCDQSGPRDARGQPVPVGTMHRLDAISKSFGGH